MGQVHIEPGTDVQLFDYYLALEDGQIKLLIEEPPRGHRINVACASTRSRRACY
jgi:hypothetical protein